MAVYSDHFRGGTDRPPKGNKMSQMGDGDGSECHLWRYMGGYRHWFDARVLATVGGEAISWLDLRPDPSRRWPDAEWKGLEFLHDDARYDADLKAQWSEFWPQRGEPPNW